MSIFGLLIAYSFSFDLLICRMEQLFLSAKNKIVPDWIPKGLKINKNSKRTRFYFDVKHKARVL